MGKDKKNYENTNTLKQVIKDLKGRKFRLDCGHHVTFGYEMGNNITIYNGKNPTIICSQCGY